MKMICEFFGAAGEIGRERQPLLGTIAADNFFEARLVDGILPRCRDLTFAGSLSMHITSLPFSARHAPATNPTYPLPTTAIFNS